MPCMEVAREWLIDCYNLAGCHICQNLNNRHFWRIPAAYGRHTGKIPDDSTLQKRSAIDRNLNIRQVGHLVTGTWSFNISLRTPRNNRL